MWHIVAKRYSIGISYLEKVNDNQERPDIDEVAASDVPNFKPVFIVRYRGQGLVFKRIKPWLVIYRTG